MISYITTKGRSAFVACEDSLTSSVLDYLKYLPINLFWRILKNSMYQNKLPKLSGELLSIEYWPKWIATDTVNSRFVEPDVFLRFEDFDLLIEAKRQNLGGQSKTQFKNETQAYFNEYGKDDKLLYFVKLGGLITFSNENSSDSRIVICKTDWTKLLKEVAELKKELEQSNNYLTEHYIRLLTDCIKGFSIHQFYSIEWLEDLQTTKINTLTIPLNFK
jgi:hypothetical protein